MNQRDAINGLIRMGANYETVRDFINYHSNNLWIWESFEKTALAEVTSGRKKMGAKELFEKLRRDNSGGSTPDLFTSAKEFKLNNNYTALYARLFILKFPQHKEAFSLKELKHGIHSRRNA